MTKVRATCLAEGFTRATSGTVGTIASRARACSLVTSFYDELHPTLPTTFHGGTYAKNRQQESR